MDRIVLGRCTTIGISMAAVMIVSCARAPRPCAALASTPAPTAARRDHCLAPPWTIDPQRPESAVQGWSAARCDGRFGVKAYFIHEGTRSLSNAEIQAIRRPVEALFVDAGAAIGIGGCCSAEVAAKTRVTCLKIWTGLCRVSTKQVISRLDGALREQGLGDGRIGVDVTFDDLVGPRCEPSDPACGSLDARAPNGPPVRSQAGCETERSLLDDRQNAASERTSTGVCTHDDECVIDGCGASRCSAWNTERREWIGCPERGREHDEKETAYCGCVSGRCAWFRPARR
jgi:hypothetical protein